MNQSAKSRIKVNTPSPSDCCAATIRIPPPSEAQLLVVLNAKEAPVGATLTVDGSCFSHVHPDTLSVRASACVSRLQSGVHGPTRFLTPPLPSNSYSSTSPA